MTQKLSSIFLYNSINDVFGSKKEKK